MRISRRNENFTKCNKNKKNKILRVTRREALNINITKISGNYSKIFAAPSLSRNPGIEKKTKKLQKQCIM